MHIKYACLIVICLLCAACGGKKHPQTTPWGTPFDSGNPTAEPTDTAQRGSHFTLDDIIEHGELIAFTLSGPETYYDYHGRGMGLHYLLCEKFAQKLGVSLRVELCQDSLEMVRRLENGDGDLIMYPLSKGAKDLLLCGVNKAWAVEKTNTALADTLNRWFKPDMVAQMKQEEQLLLTTPRVTRRVYAPLLNRAKGTISHYDHLFQRYAPVARWDWRLMAAQCYQESTFDPRAHSWAGACGLMQIIPSTAAHLGLPQSQIYEPEANIAAAAKYIAELTQHFNDVPGSEERQWFVLAAYNGGFFHIRDAMALARKHGRNPYSWAHVSEFVLKLSTPQYYRDPVVKHGYMRGTETVNYVARIRDRWSQYCGVAKGGSFGPRTTPAPARATRKHRFK